MKIQILGTGCAKCEKLAELARQAAQQSGVEFTLEKVQDINAILAFGVMTTPALAVDGKVKAVGRVPPVDEIKKMLAD